MKLKQVEENGNITLITGSLSGEIKLSVHSPEGELILEFVGTVSELKEMENLFSDEQQNEKSMINTNMELDGSELKSSLKKLSVINKENLEDDDEEELNDKEANVYQIVNEKGALLSNFKKGTVVKILDGLLNTQDSKGFKQCLSDDCLDNYHIETKVFNLATDCGIVLNINKGFKDITLYDKKDGEVVIDNTNTGHYLWSGNKPYRTENLKPFKPESEEKEFELEEDTLYYLKEPLTDKYGDTLSEGFVIYKKGDFGSGLLLQAKLQDDEQKVVIAPDNIDELVFKVRREDIVQVVSNEYSGNNVIGETGILILKDDIFKLVKGKGLLASFVRPCETEPVSDKKAQKFFDKEIKRAKGGV